MCLRPGEHQHPRQCVPAVGLFKGAPPLTPPELHPASAGVHSRTATTSMEKPTGLLQVSTLRPSFHFLHLFHIIFQCELAGLHLHLALKRVSGASCTSFLELKLKVVIM